MKAMDDSTKRYFIIMSILFVIACVGYICAIYFLDIDTEVMRDRFVNADTVFRGEVPVMEYPPFAIVFMIIPRFFASTPFTYNIAYVVEVYIFLIIGLYILCKLAERFNYDQKKAMLAYTILMLLMFEFVVDRYDIFPAVLTLLSFYCLVTKRYVFAFALLAIGTMTKLYPAVLFPIYLIPLLLDRNWTDAIKGTAALVVTALAIVVPVILIDPEMMSYFLEYHSDRPLHIESLVASLIYPFSMIGLTEVRVEYSFGSDNLLGPWPDAVAPWLTPIMLISIVLVYGLYAHFLNRSRKENSESNSMLLTGSVMVIALLLFMVLGKVFSSQYLIWIILPLIFLFMVSDDDRFKRMLFLMMVIGILLTQINFAYNVAYLGGGVNINDIGMMVILVRNIVMVALTGYLVKYVFVDRAKTSCEYTPVGTQ